VVKPGPDCNDTIRQNLIENDKHRALDPSFAEDEAQQGGGITRL
jgi:hypothetical protein